MRKNTNSVADTQVQIPLATVESHWYRIFNKYDVQQNGQIPVNFLCQIVKSNDYTHDIPSHAIKNIIKSADENRDNVITYPEFLKLVESHEGRQLFQSTFQKYINYTIPRRVHKTVVHSDGTDGDYEDEYSCNPPALGMLIISLIEIGIFLYDWSIEGKANITGPASTLFIYNPHRRKEAWRFVTYMFVHVGAFHLIVNLLVQILLGIPLEMVHSWWRVLLIYFAGVVAGSLGTSVSDPYVYLAGASGGVYALITAHLATIIMNWSEMQFAIWQLIIFLLLTGIDTGTAIYNRYVLNINEQIGYAAHLGGAIAGLLVGLCILRNLEVHTWERILCWAAVVVYFLLMFSAIIWNIVYPQYFPTQTI